MHGQGCPYHNNFCCNPLQSVIKKLLAIAIESWKQKNTAFCKYMRYRASRGSRGSRGSGGSRGRKDFLLIKKFPKVNDFPLSYSPKYSQLYQLNPHCHSRHHCESYSEYNLELFQNLPTENHFDYPHESSVL